MGKPVGQDLPQGVITLPVILFLTSHADDPDATAFRSGECGPDVRGRFFEKIRLSDAIEQSREYARRYIGRAAAALESFPGGPHQKALETLAMSIV